MTSAATRILRARGHFEVLGLPREQCTSAAVRAQFTKLVKEVHPDKCSHPDAAADVHGGRRPPEGRLWPPSEARPAVEVALLERSAMR